MIRINNIKMPVKHNENDLKKTVYKLYKINENEVKSFEIAGQAIDARKKIMLYLFMQWIFPLNLMKRWKRKDLKV